MENFEKLLASTIQWFDRMVLKIKTLLEVLSALLLQG